MKPDPEKETFIWDGHLIGFGVRCRPTGAILGHSDSATTSRYAHLSASPVQAAADSISKTIAAAMDGRPAITPRKLKVVK